MSLGKAAAAGEATTDEAKLNVQTRGLAFLEGPIVRTLIIFSLPILASNVLQSLNASINAIWIGQLLGTRALTASANANSLLFLLLSAGFGLGLAATVLIGQCLGARDLVEAKRVVGTTFVFFGFVSVVTAAGGLAITARILQAMQTPMDAVPLATAYLRVIFLGIPAMFLTTFVTMALRGAGDSRTPFYFMLISASLDAGLNPLLIRGAGAVPGMGIAGSALATALSQWLTLIALVLWLYWRRNTLCIRRGEFGYLRIDRAVLWTLLVKGIPMGLQVIVMSSSMMMLIGLMNRYGSTVVAAYGACLQLWNYIAMPALAVGMAVSSMAAQNMGAGRWDRVRGIVIAGVTYNILLTGALVVAVTLSDNFAFRLFLGRNSGAIEIAKHMHLIVSWSYVLFGVSFVLSSVMRSSGVVMPPLLILILSVWGVRLPLASLLSRFGMDGILYGFTAGSIASLVLTFAYYRFGPWRQTKRLLSSVERSLDERDLTASRAPPAV